MQMWKDFTLSVKYAASNGMLTDTKLVKDF